ncbi:MAG: hypothetical protein II114_09175, partial [Treponema sp.]|nr:hypothetical protein [Treponema sp.]
TLDYDSSGNVIPCYKATDNNKYYAIRWDFDGKAENISTTGTGVFRQHLINYGTTNPTKNADGTYTYGSVENETYWFGSYDIRGDSAYSKGKLYLSYQVGFDVDDAVKAGVTANTTANTITGAGSTTAYNKTVADDIVKVLDTWKLENFLNHAYGNTSGLDNIKTTNTALHGLAYNANDATTNCGGTTKLNFVTVQVRYNSNDTKILCSDIEYFRFNLRDVSGTGYCRMMDTVLDKDGSTTIGGIYNQWASSGNAIDQSGVSTKISYNGADAYRVHAGTSWTGTNTRYMGRIDYRSTPANPNWISSTSDKNNATIFSVTEADSTDYRNPESDIVEK